jgi:tight adherence protein B
MSIVTSVALATAGVVLLIGILARGVFGFAGSGAGAREQAIRSMVASQRRRSHPSEDGDDALATSDVSPTPSPFETPIELEAPKAADNRLSLQKRLKYAQLSFVPPWILSAIQIVLSVGAFIAVQSYFGALLQLISLSVGPLIVNWFIDFRMQRRFEAFDRDYPQFLLSFVGMLKTGLNTVQALEAAAGNLDDKSLVRLEVELMLERLRLGVTEERSIGSFGEDVNHPEIELFVQALLLSRKVGGNLSETIERLTKQVRKRQSFRSAAVAAVGLQRGSILFILGILFSLELYLYCVWPECVTVAWKTQATAPYVQGALAIILLGMYLVRQVTKIKV